MQDHEVGPALRKRKELQQEIEVLKIDLDHFMGAVTETLKNPAGNDSTALRPARDPREMIARIQEASRELVFLNRDLSPYL